MCGDHTIIYPMYVHVGVVDTHVHADWARNQVAHQQSINRVCIHYTIRTPSLKKAYTLHQLNAAL